MKLTIEPQVSVVCAVVRRQADVLIVRRAQAEGVLLWTFPSGKIEAGETPGGAAVREVMEEAGVVVRPVRSIGERQHPDTLRHMIYVLCAYVGGIPDAVKNAREVSAARFVSPEEALSLITSDIFPPAASAMKEPL